jgi:integrase
LASEKFASLAPNTQVNWRHKLRLAEIETGLGGLSIHEIDSGYVQDFLDGLAQWPATQAAAKKALKAVEKWAVVRRRLPRPITFGTDIIGSTGAREPWLDREVELAIANASPELARAIQLVSYTGLRLGDVSRMRWGDLRVYRGRLGIDVDVEKTHIPMWAPVLPELEPLLLGWERRGEHILCKPNGEPWKRSQLSDAWGYERDSKPALEPLRARKLSFHGLRATAAIRLRRSGLSNALIGKMIGMSEAVVNLYCRRADQADDAITGLEQREKVVALPFKQNMKDSG